MTRTSAFDDRRTGRVLHRRDPGREPLQEHVDEDASQVGTQAHVDPRREADVVGVGEPAREPVDADVSGSS